MSNQILWIDNDTFFLAPHILRLKTEGYDVHQVTTLTEGFDMLKNNNYVLLILDVMMPVKDYEEEIFPPNQTNSGKESGLLFYKNNRTLLSEKGIPVFVLTVREEISIRDSFLKAGLPKRNYMTKSEVGDTAIFLERVKELEGRARTDENKS